MNPYDTRDLVCPLSVTDDQPWDTNGAERKTAPAGNRGLTSTLVRADKEALVTIMHRESDNTPRGAH